MSVKTRRVESDSLRILYEGRIKKGRIKKSVDPCPHCRQPRLQTSSKNDSRVWGGIGYSRSVATGGSARVATEKRSSSAEAMAGQAWWCRRRQDRARLTSLYISDA